MPTGFGHDIRVTPSRLEQPLGNQTQFTDKVLDILEVDSSAVEAARHSVEQAQQGTVLDHLLAAGAVSELVLLEAMSQATELAPADPADYSRIELGAFKLIDAPTIQEHRLVPFRRDQQTLGVFVVEPLDEQIARTISERHDIVLTQFIWPQARYLEAGYALSGDILPEWVADFMGQTDHRVSFEGNPAPPIEPGAGADWSEPMLGAGLSESTAGLSEPTGPKNLSESSKAFQMGAGWTREQMRSFVQQCYDRDALLEALLGYGGRWLDSRMVLVLSGGAAQPYLVEGWSELPDKFRDLDALRQIRVPVPEDSPLFDPEQVGSVKADKPEEVGLGKLFVELTLFPPDKLMVQTVRIGTRPSMAILGEPCSDADNPPPVKLLECGQSGGRATRRDRTARQGRSPAAGR